MHLIKEKIKNLQAKIYTKQKKLLEIMHESNISNYNDIFIKTNVDEINLLDEILDIWVNDYKEHYKFFWKDV